MSWYIKAVGTPEALRNKIDEERHIPDHIKKGMKSMIEFSVPSHRLVALETSGHVERVLGPAPEYQATGEVTNGQFEFKVQIFDKL